MNVLECRLVERRAQGLFVSAGPLAFEATSDDGAPAKGGAVAVGIRPEDVLIEPEGSDGATSARLVGTVFHGRTLRLHAVLSDGTALTIDAPRRSASAQYTPGDMLNISVRPGAARALRAA